MKLNELKPKEGSVKERTRVGRGIGSGKGKTSGKGQKGQKSRTGVAIKGFEGGQMPLYRRLPKRGFNNIFGKKYAELTLGRLQEAIDSKAIDPKKTLDCETLMAAKVARRKPDGVRVIGGGELKAKVTLKIAGVSGPAKEQIEKAGGSVEVVVPEDAAEKAAAKKGKATAKAKKGAPKKRAEKKAKASKKK